MNAVVDYAVDTGVAVITVDSPPVNALSAPVRAGVYRGVETGDGRCGGRRDRADLRGPHLHRRRRHHRVRQAAGVAVAAGRADPDRERAQAGGRRDPRHGARRRPRSWRWRALPRRRADAKLGLPEVNLGLHPGRRRHAAPAARGRRGGGAGDDHQRRATCRRARSAGAGLARRAGARASCVPRPLAFARGVVAEGRAAAQGPRADDKLEAARADAGDLRASSRKANARQVPRLPGAGVRDQRRRGGVNLPFDEGLREEQRLFARAAETATQSAAQRYVVLRRAPGARRSRTFPPTRRPATDRAASASSAPAPWAAASR